MKIFVRTLLLLIFLSQESNNGATRRWIPSIAVAGGGCSTLSIDHSGVFDDFYPFITSTWFASKFTPGSGVTLCMADINFVRVGTAAAGTMQASIYTDNGGSPSQPSTLVGTASVTVDRTTFPTSSTYISFTGLSANLTGGTVYWLVVKASAVGTNGSNDDYVISHTQSGSPNIRSSSDGGSTWQDVSTTKELNWKGYVSP